MSLAIIAQQLRKSRRRSRALQQMQSLVEVYAPLCFVLGWLCRKCYWVGRERGTGRWARQGLELALHMLLGLLGDKAPRCEYVRAISVSLLSWTSWHDALPAAFFVEEACEAHLAKLGATCRHHPRCVSPQEVSDLYLRLGPPSGKAKDAGRHPVTDALRNAVRDHLRQLREAPDTQVGFVPWRARKWCVVEAEWSLTPTTTTNPFDVPEALYVSALRRALVSLSSGGDLDNAQVLAMLQRLVRRRSAAEVRELQRVQDSVARWTGPMGPRITAQDREAMRVADVEDGTAQRHRRTVVNNELTLNRQLERVVFEMDYPSDPDLSDSDNDIDLQPTLVGIPNVPSDSD